MVSMGLDPRSEKREKIAKQNMTVELMVADFIDKYAKPKNSSWKQAENNLRLYLVTALGKKSIHDVKRPDIHAILDDLVERGKLTAANRALAHIRKFFGWLVERGYLEYSPADHIKKRHQELERAKVLSDQEINLKNQTKRNFLEEIRPEKHLENQIGDLLTDNSNISDQLTTRLKETDESVEAGQKQQRLRPEQVPFKDLESLFVK